MTTSVIRLALFGFLVCFVFFIMYSVQQNWPYAILCLIAMTSAGMIALGLKSN